jgi:SAM-dependent methyltransferase
MAVMRAIGHQLAHPRGWRGRIVGAVMDRANRVPTRLALARLAAQAGEEVLDAGCGTGATAAALLGRVPCTVACLDSSPTMLHVAQRRDYGLGRDGLITFHAGAIGALPFGDAQFDAVLAINVLYFCDVLGLADLRRVLRPGGRLVAYVTARESMSRWPFVRHGTHRLFDARTLEEMFVHAGFAPERIVIEPVAAGPGVFGLIACATA